MQAISTKTAPSAIGPYSQAVRAGGFVFLSGQIPLDPGTGKMIEGGIEPQIERVLDNLGAVLKAGGLTFDHVVRTTIYLADLADFQAVNEAYGKRFTRAPQPARSTVQVAGLPRGARVEVDAIAVVPQLPG
jgi:2-iminobutanoate/2-iminopropanoate deaminase